MVALQVGVDGGEAVRMRDVQRMAVPDGAYFDPGNITVGGCQNRNADFLIGRDVESCMEVVGAYLARIARKERLLSGIYWK